MNEVDLRALQLTQQAVLRLIEETQKSLQKNRETELMTAEEVATTLRISLWRFYHAYSNLDLTPVRRTGRRLLFQREQVRRILDAKESRRGRPPNRLRAVLGDFASGMRGGTK